MGLTSCFPFIASSRKYGMKMMCKSMMTTSNRFSNISISPENREKVQNEEDSSKERNPKRVWLPKEVEGEDIPDRLPMYWNRSVDETDLNSMRSIIDHIGIQERQGGRMRQRKLGVLREDPAEDMRLLIENYTVPSLASALRDREEALQLCATLLAEQKIDELSVILRPFEQRYVERRRRKEIRLDLSNGFNQASLEMLRKGLNRMPRRVGQAHQRRAGVVLPLCNVDGVPCVLFEKRSAKLRAHADEVCLPGGMVSSSNDKSIVDTCLREMYEEIEGLGENSQNVVTLGVLRCNWGEVHHLGEYCNIAIFKFMTYPIIIVQFISDVRIFDSGSCRYACSLLHWGNRER